MKNKKTTMKSKKAKKAEQKTFRIFRVEKKYVKPGLFKKAYVKTVKITMKRFIAKNNEEALKELQSYIKVANREYVYYFEETHLHTSIGKNGKKKTFDSIIDKWEDEERNRPFIIRAWNKITLELWYWIIDRPKSVKHWIEDLVYLVKNKHSRNESWNLDDHMLEDLLWNIPILIKNKHGVAMNFINRSVKETHSNEKGFDINEWNKTHFDCTDEEMKRAIKYQDDEFAKMIEYVKLYKYYRDCGVVDENDPDQCEFDKKWRHTLPIIQGTYDSLDYSKLRVLTERSWNKIWDWMKNYGEALWD